jgi:isocitrate/isopropylmalate dehydrogenase
MKTYDIAVIPGDGVGNELARKRLRFECRGDKYAFKFKTRSLTGGVITI